MNVEATPAAGLVMQWGIHILQEYALCRTWCYGWSTNGVVSTNGDEESV